MTSFVGLTGGIASGKSTVSRIFAELGVPIVDADQVAREVVEPGSDGLEALVQAFGSSILAPEGTLDRKALGARVFADTEARKKLDSITHPRIALRSLQKMAAVAATHVPYGIYDAALLVENGSYRGMAALVVVAAHADAQRSRLRSRDGLDDEQAQARLAAQLPLEDKIRVADYVIWNDSDLDTLASRTREIHETLLKRFHA